jgi:hypothetical protein
MKKPCDSSCGRNCKYGGEPEYWVEVRETGEKGQEREQKKRRIEITKDFYVVIVPDTDA